MSWCSTANIACSFNVASNISVCKNWKRSIKLGCTINKQIFANISRTISINVMLIINKIVYSSLKWWKNMKLRFLDNRDYKLLSFAEQCLVNRCNSKCCLTWTFKNCQIPDVFKLVFWLIQSHESNLTTCLEWINSERHLLLFQTIKLKLTLLASF